MIEAALMLTICAAEDLRSMKVRRSWLYLWALALLCRQACGCGVSVGGAAPGLVWLAASAAVRGAWGRGDGWCLLLCGMTAGTENTLRILAAASLSAAAFVFLCRRRGCAGDTIPFVPFLAGAAWLVCAENYLGGSL